MIARLSALSTLMLLVAPPSEALQVTYYLIGTLTSSGNSTVLFPGIDPSTAVGTTFTGRVTYDTSLPVMACSPGSPLGRRCIYEATPPLAPLGIELTVPVYGTSFATADASSFTITVDNENISVDARDLLSFYSADVATFQAFAESIDVTLNDDTGVALFDENLQPYINFSSYQIATCNAFLTYFDGMVVGQFFLTADVDSMYPATLLAGSPGVSCATVTDLGVELCGDALTGIFYGEPIGTDSLPQGAMTALSAIQLAGVSPQLWELGLDGGFNGTATLTFSYDEGAFCAGPACVPDVDEDQLTLFRFDSGMGAWVSAPPTLRDTAQNTLVIDVTGFSAFALALPEPSPGLAGVVATGVLACLSHGTRRRRRKRGGQPQLPI